MLAGCQEATVELLNIVKIKQVIWIRYGHRPTTILLLFLILIIYQFLSVSYLWNNMPDTLFLPLPRHFWKCTGSSHIIVSLEFVQLDKLKVRMKTVLLWSLLIVMPGQGSRQLHLVLNSELKYIMLWQASQITEPSRVGCSFEELYMAAAVENFIKLKSAFSNTMQKTRIAKQWKRFSCTGTLGYLIILIWVNTKF